jgi:hypothetical protein
MLCTRQDCDLIQESADNNKTDHCDTTEILLKMALNTKTLSLKVAHYHLSRIGSRLEISTSLRILKQLWMMNEDWTVSDNQCCVFFILDYILYSMRNFLQTLL